MLGSEHVTGGIEQAVITVNAQTPEIVVKPITAFAVGGRSYRFRPGHSTECGEIVGADATVFGGVEL